MLRTSWTDTNNSGDVKMVRTPWTDTNNSADVKMPRKKPTHMGNKLIASKVGNAQSFNKSQKWTTRKNCDNRKAGGVERPEEI